MRLYVSTTHRIRLEGRGMDGRNMDMLVPAIGGFDLPDMFVVNTEGEDGKYRRVGTRVRPVSQRQ